MPRKDKKVLTKPQQQTMDALSRYFLLNRQSPTVAELSGILRLKSQSVIDRLTALEKKGFIRRIPQKWRNIEIVDRNVFLGSKIVQVPVTSSVGADNLSVFARQEFDQFLHITEGLLKGYRDVFAVRSIGNSMIDAGILNGDYVLAEEATLESVSSGEKVIVVVGDMAAVKRLEKGENFFVLHSENKSGQYNSIVIPAEREDFKVVGRVVNVLHFSEPDDIELHYEEGYKKLNQ